MLFFALAETAISLYMCVLEHVDPWDLQGCIPGRSCLTSFSVLLPFVKTKCCIKPLDSKARAKMITVNLFGGCGRQAVGKVTSGMVSPTRE